MKETEGGVSRESQNDLLGLYKTLEDSGIPYSEIERLQKEGTFEHMTHGMEATYAYGGRSFLIKKGNGFIVQG
ncbi:MAG TPA: hypothetical protein VJJ02_05375 [Candidatus Paceibacterota bacterium]